VQGIGEDDGEGQSRQEGFLEEVAVFKSEYQKPGGDGVVVHACNSSIWEAEAVESQVQGQPGLHNEALYLKRKRRMRDLGTANLAPFSQMWSGGRAPCVAS
jgi:hypothetical protein